MSEIAVLLVEDDDYWSRTITEALEGAASSGDGAIYSVSRAASPDEALAFADRAKEDGRPYDIAILDLELGNKLPLDAPLPDGRIVRMRDGLWLFHELNEKHRLLCIIVSAHDDPESQRAADKMDVHGFLPKPLFGLQETREDREDKLRIFYKKLRRLCADGVAYARESGSVTSMPYDSTTALSGSTNNAQDGDERKLVNGPLTIDVGTLDPTSWNLYFRGCKIDLPPAPQPFRVLALLMENNVANIGEIFKLLDYDEPRDDKEFRRRLNSVQHCISSLRAKLEPLCGGEDPIRNVRDSDTRRVVGYKLVWPFPT